MVNLKETQHMITFRRLRARGPRNALALVLRQSRRPGRANHRSTLLIAKGRADRANWQAKSLATTLEGSEKAQAYAQAEVWFEISEAIRLAHNIANLGNGSFLLPPGFVFLGS